jgi:hypothetical protein
MRRREFITLVGVALAWPAAAHAQKTERWRLLLSGVALIRSTPANRRQNSG